MKGPFASLLVVIALASGAAAHDFWIQPDTFFPPKDRPVPVRVFVGDGFVKESERAFEKPATPRLRLVGAEGETDLLPSGREGKTPFVEVTLKRAGSHWVALERGRKTIRLEAAKFNEYLAEEGLDHVLEQRRLAKEDQKPGRERYGRYLKCLVQSGAADEGWKRACGHRLEIVPLSDPCAAKPGGTLEVRVLFEGKPLAKVSLFALRRDGEKVHKQKLTTGADGTAEVKVGQAGVWLLRLVHMRRCPDPAEADWESFWTSLTFAVP
jgi:uncharacterized GH25 family protein